MEKKNYDPMWAKLGIDLEAHARLMNGLGAAYGDIYLSQRNRPKGMEYLDFVLSEIHGLRVEELQNAKSAGRKVVGSFCLYVPEEILLAASAASVGLCAGAEIGTQAAEAVLPRKTCVLIKSFMGFKLDRLCPYVESCDLVIGETTCDGKTKAYEIFNEYKETFVLQIPRMKSPEGLTLWKIEIRRLVRRIEELTGNRVTVETLSRGIRTVNAKRRALHRLNALRAARPSPISGLDALLINQVQFYDDPDRFTRQIEGLCDEIEGRVWRQEGVAPANAPRVLVSGCPMAAPNWKLPFVIEGSGALLPDRLRGLHPEHRPHGAHRGDGPQVSRRRGGPLRAPVLHAVPD